MNNNSANSIKDFFKQWPRFYYFVYDNLGPLYFGGLNPKKFLRRYSSATDVKVNVGSGARRLASGVTNVDLQKYSGVDVVANITNLPFQTNSVDVVVCDQVLEHVSEPDHAVQEIHRILKPGGRAYISTPFLYPFHASPSDFQRWTIAGYRKLLGEFEIIEEGARCGPFSVLTVFLAYFCASLLSFGVTRAYWFLVYSFSILFSPIRYLDVIALRLPFSRDFAAALYVVCRKK